MIYCAYARTLILAGLVLIGFAPVRANIGDTIGDLRGRYGGAKNVGGGMLFQHDGFSICVYFDGARSAMEVFVRDGSKPGKTDITDDDVEKILAAEAVGMRWNPVETRSGLKTWLSSNNKLIARITLDDKTGEKTLMIMANEK